MRRTLLTMVMGVGLAWPALASSGLHCHSADGATISMGIGNVPVFHALGAHIEADGVVLNSEDGTIGAVNGFAEADGSIRVDFTDDNVNAIVARLRLFRAIEADSFAMAGVLQVTDVGAYAVICDEP